jgi:hypothetical protein
MVYRGSIIILQKNEFSYSDTVRNGNEFDTAIEYYDSNDTLTKREAFYSDDTANVTGYNREIDYYDGNGKTTKIEIFYTNSFAKNNGFNSVVIYYHDGTPTRVENYMNRQLVKNSSVSNKQNIQPRGSRAR